jgi:hypothetical protein
MRAVAVYRLKSVSRSVYCLLVVASARILPDDYIAEFGIPLDVYFGSKVDGTEFHGSLVYIYGVRDEKGKKRIGRSRCAGSLCNGLSAVPFSPLPLLSQKCAAASHIGFRGSLHQPSICPRSGW